MSETLGDLASTSLKTGSDASDFLAFVFMILNLDSSGATYKFSQISKLISRLRLMDLNYGKRLGSFLKHMGKAFDGENKGDSDDVKIEAYKRKQLLLTLLSIGKKSKFDSYTIRVFLFGTFRENWESKLIYDLTKAQNSEIQENRLLQSSAIQPVANNKIKWSFAFAELKYWLYIISWFSKLYGLYLYKVIKKQ